MKNESMSNRTKRDHLRNDMVFIREAIQRKLVLMRKSNPASLALTRIEYDALINTLAQLLTRAEHAVDVLDDALIREADDDDAATLATVRKEAYGE
jgi:hypothetical protein